MSWECGTDIYIPPCVKQTASGSLLYRKELSPVLCDDLQGGMGRGGREAQGKWNISMLTADSLCCTAETNTTL